MKKELMNSFSKAWDNDYNGKKCPVCESRRVVLLTNKGWWNYYFKCKDCNSVIEYSHGDSMGGQPDGIFLSDGYKMNKDLNGKYGKEMLLDEGEES